MLIQSQTNDFGIGSKSYYLFGADLMILRIYSSDLTRKETNSFFFFFFMVIVV